MNLNKLTRLSLSFHRKTFLVSGIISILFIFSGILHPVTKWTGPHATKLAPPELKVSTEVLRQLPSILQKNSITSARLIKVVPSPDGPLLQVTQEEFSKRRYFSFKTNTEVIDYDIEYAKWLANYYVGNKVIKNIEKINEFSSEYPTRSRFLPVYKVTFNDSGKTQAFIYTETSILVSIGNAYTKSVRKIFSLLHSWTWLDDYEILRVVLMTLLQVLMLMLIITGGILLKGTRVTKRMSKNRLFHRKIALFFSVPFFLFTFSGIYHLIKHSDYQDKKNFFLPKSYNIGNSNLNPNMLIPKDISSKEFSSINLVEFGENQLFYRFQEKAKEGKMRNSAYFLNALNGQVKENLISDKTYAESVFKRNFPKATPLSVTTQRHFSTQYSFKNKRLPVWKFTLPDRMIFIDSVTGIIVDQSLQSDNLERLSFSFLHMWSMLRPLVGAKTREILIFLTLMMLMILCGTGLYLGMQYYKRSNGKK